MKPIVQNATTSENSNKNVHKTVSNTKMSQYGVKKPTMFILRVCIWFYFS
jgi:hypothetical protein